MSDTDLLIALAIIRYRNSAKSSFNYLTSCQWSHLFELPINGSFQKLSHIHLNNYLISTRLVTTLDDDRHGASQLNYIRAMVINDFIQFLSNSPNSNKFVRNKLFFNFISGQLFPLTRTNLKLIKLHCKFLSQLITPPLLKDIFFVLEKLLLIYFKNHNSHHNQKLTCQGNRAFQSMYRARRIDWRFVKYQNFKFLNQSSLNVLYTLIKNIIIHVLKNAYHHEIDSNSVIKIKSVLLIIDDQDLIAHFQLCKLKTI
ncbi:hypothetical protein TBLA_0D04740 [Henningerozyma blattae CBS 6284]|uniref:Uncharacterized protein n=1 Tax=Henningerozyma blattae (strain ATCC 34711 / CBS 6284 / DSM 70876 / NBRC 10599 / NRRL Y-10934 / UCD 77-7) TaxID=1071380 RepID=I2H3L8_HENB6|nr:hypothetical protein TBLA_0D04740 [Tetrapisispora blattae CBS 6284]CCH60970.1 hypothetical protein TBLA_0D04740 [Tetrapisispora blattae CBS 6284]